MASQIGLIETAVQTAIEGTSITSCYLGMFGDGIGTPDKPYARLLFGSSSETKDDMNGYRDVWYPVVIEIVGNEKESVRAVMDEIRILFDGPTLRNTLAGSTMRALSTRYVGESQPMVFRTHGNCVADMEFEMRVRYYYAQ